MLQFNVVWCIHSCREIMPWHPIRLWQARLQSWWEKVLSSESSPYPSSPGNRYGSNWIRRSKESWARSMGYNMWELWKLDLQNSQNAPPLPRHSLAAISSPPVNLHAINRIGGDFNETSHLRSPKPTNSPAWGVHAMQLPPPGKPIRYLPNFSIVGGVGA